MKKMSFNSVEFEAPEDWIDASVVTVVAPESRTFRPNVVVTRDDLEAPIDIAAYARGEAKDLKKSMKKYILHKEQETVVGGRNAFMIEHSFRSGENVQVRQIQLFVARASTVYTLGITSGEDDFEALRDRFETIEQSFKLI